MSDLQHAIDLRERAEEQRRNGDRETAIATYIEAVAALRICDAPLKLAHTIRHLADLYRETGRRDESAKCYEEALAIYRGRDDTPRLDLANAIRGYAALTDDAALWREALELYRETGVEAGVAEASRRLAR